jgi:DNA-binding LacI/PurR family transcriptional regulator
LNATRITQKDIARKLGVSQTAVGLALKNHYRISPELREKVRRAAEQLGYQPDPFLSGLAAYRHRKIKAAFQGVIGWVNRWNQPERLRSYGEFEGYWRGATEAAKRLGYCLEEIQWAEDCSAKRFQQILIARGILGILVPPHHRTINWDGFDWRKFSLIRFGTSVHSPDSNVVTSDQHRAVVMAVTRMKEYGYSRIGFIVSRGLNRSLGGNYYGGFSWAQQLLELNPMLPPFWSNGDNFESKPAPETEALRFWLDEHKPDAVLTTEVHIPGLIQKLGHRIPQDIAVAGTSVRDLPLDAGIDQRSEGVGKIAVEMLVKQIQVNERGEPAEPCRILVESVWQDGKSLPRRRNVDHHAERK